MKRLTLLRHAKSSWDDPKLSDHDRPLAKRGRRDAPRMGRRLAQRGLEPDLLLTSPAVRARQTTELVAPELERPEMAIRLEPRLYMASAGELLAVLADQSDDIEEILLIGHNPELTQLVNMMLPTLRLQNLPTAGAVAMSCEADSWRAIDSAEFSLRFLDYPKNPEAVA